MTLAQDITARAAQNGRTFDQQAAYERMVGDSQTVRDQAAMRDEIAAPAHWEDDLIDPADTLPTPRYTITTNHPDVKVPYATTDTRTDAIRLAHELHGIRAENGATSGAVLVRDAEHAGGGAFIYRIDADGKARAL